MVVAEALVKAYDDLQRGELLAVNGLSFAAHAGEAFGLLGPNGAGKTTALRILTTLLKPTSGAASVNGFDCVTQAELVRNQVGFISAGTAVYDRMTAWEFVEYFGRLHGLNAVDLRQSPEAFRRSLEKNLVHYFSAVHFALDDLIESRGVILNIAAKTAGTSRLQSS